MKKKYCYLDANIWLSLYYFSSNNITAFQKFEAKLGKKVVLCLPTQTKDEILRNREKKLKAALDDMEKNFVSLKVPVFCQSYPEYSECKSAFDDYEKKHKAMIEKVKADIKTKTLLADNLVDLLIGKSEMYDSSSYIEFAETRYKLGNPPGKENKIGDAVNWLTLLNKVPDGCDLYFVSDDADYRSSLSDGQMKDYLIDEWQEKKKSKIHFSRDLNGFLKAIDIDIELEINSEKDQLIEALLKSYNFANTHAVIARLAEYSDWSQAQKIALCDAFLSNQQVSWIAADTDISDFYQAVFGQIEGYPGEEAIGKIRNALTGCGE